MLPDAESEFDSLSLYAWDDEILWGVGSEALSSGVWQQITAADDIYLSNFGTMDVKVTSHVAAVAKGSKKFASWFPVDGDVDVDVDLWHYRVFSQLLYVPDMCSCKDEYLAAWRGRYLVHADELFWGRAIIKAEFRYTDRADSTYGNSQIRWERRTLSVLLRFVSY